MSCPRFTKSLSYYIFYLYICFTLACLQMQNWSTCKNSTLLPAILGYVRIIPDCFCACTKTIPDMASVHKGTVISARFL